MENEAARERIETEQARVQGLVQGLRDDLSAEGDDSSEITDPADHGSDTFEREKDLAILEGLESDLAEIEAALQRLEDGSYGVDEVTGAPIDRARLEALPTARTNVDTPH